MPDTASPIDLTGITIKFVLAQDRAVTVYSGSNVLVVPLQGKITVELTPTQTALLKLNAKLTASYLEFTDTDGETYSKYQLTETVAKKETK